MNQKVKTTSVRTNRSTILLVDDDESVREMIGRGETIHRAIQVTTSAGASLRLRGAKKG